MNSRPVAICVILLFFSLAVPSISIAQEEITIEDLRQSMNEMKEEYEERIGALELTLELMEAGVEEPPFLDEPGENVPYYRDMGVSPGRIGELGQTDRFSRTFNPAIGLVLDMLANATTDNVSRGKQDQIWLRVAELSIAAQIDPYGYAYANLEGSDGEFGVGEAVGVLNRLPANFSLKGGLMLADITKFGQRHVHELPFVEKPSVLVDYIGGSLRGTGVELHQWFGLSDTTPLRWSLGMFTGLKGHSHTLAQGHVHDHGHDDFSGKRHLKNFQYGGRITSYTDLDEENSLQLGGSLYWAPEIATESEGLEFTTHRTIGGLDATYKWQDPSSRQTLFVGGELLLSNGRFLHEAVGGGHGLISETSYGGYLWTEYAWSPDWSVGALVDVYELRENADVLQKDYSAFITRNLSHFRRLRFQYRFNDLDRGEGSWGHDYHEFILQWAIILGTHAHGLDW